MTINRMYKEISDLNDKELRIKFQEERIKELEKRLEWQPGLPPIDDDGSGDTVMGKIQYNDNFTIAPVVLIHYIWHWGEGVRKMSEGFQVVGWMFYPDP